MGKRVVTKLSDPTSATPKASSGAGPERIVRLTCRRQFLNAAKGKRFHAAAFTLQSAPDVAPAPKRSSRSSRDEATEVGAATPVPGGGGPARFGITVTKKTGGAVARNRIRRRLKEALRCLVPLPARPGHDYVIVARREALGMPFSMLQQSITEALARIAIPRSNARDARRGSATGPHEPLGSNPRPPRKDRTGEAPKA